MQVICEQFERCKDKECLHIVPHNIDRFCHGFCDWHGETRCMEIVLKEVSNTEQALSQKVSK